MKNSANLNSTEWCDIIFEGKNKSYGAFQLRQSSWKRHLAALGIIISFVVFISFLPAIVSSVSARVDTFRPEMTDPYTIVEVDNKHEELIAEVVRPEVPEPPKLQKMQKFVPPTIVDDADAPDDEGMTGMEDLLNNKDAVIGAFEVPEGSTDADAVRKEFADQVMGTGSGSGQTQSAGPIFNADFMPVFPGGEAEMYKFIAENLNYPAVDQEMGNQGRATIRFVVSKTGEISNLELLKGVSPTCDKEAMRVIKSMPKWIPGKQGGKPVAVYFTIPIVFKLK